MKSKFIEPNVEIQAYIVKNVLMASSFNENDLDHTQEDIFDWGGQG